MSVPSELAALADAHGVATWYRDGARRRVEIAPDAVVAVLGQLGVDATGTTTIRRELAAARHRQRRTGGLPHTLVVRQGDHRRRLPGLGVLVDEHGTARPLADLLPDDLTPGWYDLRIADRSHAVLVAPRALAPPPRCWGWTVQLYALRSAGSWGMGDLADLRELVASSGRDTAGLVLCNPLSAVTPASPIQSSPYSPTSRRFANPLYLRIDDTTEYRRADARLRAEVDALRPTDTDRIDYDRVWTAKRAALALLFPLAGHVAVDRDPALRDFATFCALAETHGADWRRWPVPLRRPDTPAVAAARTELAPTVAFHAWLQRLCAEQLATVRQAAEEAGMPVGVIHDLPVGADRAGADAWCLQDVLAGEVSVGAPPDAFNAQGQDWGLPPWRPDRLDAAGYLPYRQMLAAVLDRGHGLRVDHVAGLFRLWWIPPGGSAADGTYVRYDGEAMLGALALEAHRRDAVVIGEDLGTVEETVTEALRDRRMLGCQVLWFARDAASPGEPLLPPARWPASAAASISTHDLPTATGFLTGEHVRVRDRLHLLGRPLAAELAGADRERGELLALLGAEGLLPAEPTEDDIVFAMHGLLARSPCRLLLVAPYDAIGEHRQPNLPGTTDSYPNWRLPLPVGPAELLADPRVVRISRLLAAAVADAAPPADSGAEPLPVPGVADPAHRVADPAHRPAGPR